MDTNAGIRQVWDGIGPTFACSRPNEKSHPTRAKELIVEALALRVPDKAPRLMRDSSRPHAGTMGAARTDRRAEVAVERTAAAPVEFSP